ncbi:MAG: ribosome biogenesis factor YjgA [Gammaproteobacteria bacterium]
MIENNEETHGFDDTEQRVSKSHMKRESAALQDLAAELADLPKTQLTALSLPDEIFTALCQAAAMPPRGARKRQLKYVGGLLREMEDIAPIVEKLARLKNQNAAAARELHKAERWRERLISGDDTVLAEFINAYPAADRQQLRHYIRNAQKEAVRNAPPKSARLLFRYLRELFETAENP